jgi:hypothetical protein
MSPWWKNSQLPLNQHLDSTLTHSTWAIGSLFQSKLCIAEYDQQDQFASPLLEYFCQG